MTTPGRQAYHRTTSRDDMLSRCSPRIASFYRLWESKLNGRRMPARRDFDPLEMRDWLPGIVLVTVEHDPLRLTYRLVGTRSVELKQRDVTGQRVEEGYHGSSLEEILENYHQVIDGRCLVYDWEVVASKSEHIEDVETILLPLSDDDATVNMVLVYFEIANHDHIRALKLP